jgi:hypothetical protein
MVTTKIWNRLEKQSIRAINILDNEIRYVLLHYVDVRCFPYKIENLISSLHIKLRNFIKIHFYNGFFENYVNIRT